MRRSNPHSIDFFEWIIFSLMGMCYLCWVFGPFIA